MAGRNSITLFGCVSLLLFLETGFVSADDGCAHPDAGSCCVPAEQGVVGCNDEACCILVCEFDPPCCDTSWDELCVGSANDLCNDSGDYCGPCQGSGKVFTVPIPYPDIASGVAAACDGDIVLVAPGVYQEQVVVEGKQIQLISEEGPEKTIIDANFEGSCFSVVEVGGGGASIDGFTLRNGVGNSSIFWAYGGSIFCYLSNVSAYNCVMEEGVIEFGDGAAVWVSRDSTMTIEDCTIQNNRILYGYKGGGMYAVGNSDVYIRDTDFLNNTAVQGAAGAIYSEGGILDIIGCRFESHISGSAGGAIECLGGVLRLEDSEFINNQCGSFGAAVLAGGAESVLVDGCLFSGNSGGSYGGGLHLAGNSTDRQIVNTVFSGNFVTSDGAGIQFNGGGGVIRDCTFLSNECHGRGGGIKAENCSVEVRDSVFIDNHANDDGGGIDVVTGAQDIIIVGNSFFQNHSGQIRFGEPVGGRGGGLRVQAERPQIVSNMLVGNYTFDHGGGILVEGAGADALIANMLVVGNTSFWSGGGMHLENSSAPVHNCTVIDNYCGERFGGIRGGGPIYNSIVRGNRAKQSLQADNNAGNLEFFNCNIEGDFASVGPDEAIDFVNRVGSDLFSFTGDEDFSVTDCSTILELGRSDLLPQDSVDLDQDGDTNEPLPLDLAGNPRVVGELDLGAFELQAEGQPCTGQGDCDGNGIADYIDLAQCDGSSWCLDCDGNSRLDVCDLVESDPIFDGGSVYWRFEDPDDLLFDSSRYQMGAFLRNGVSSNDVPVGVIPANGAPNTRSLQFDGVGRIVADEITEFLGFARNQYTIEAWVRLDQIASGPNSGSRQYLVHKKELDSSDDEMEYGMLVQAGNVRQDASHRYGKQSGFTGHELAIAIGECTNRWVIVSDLEITDYEWHHVSFAVDQSGEYVRFGLDGSYDYVEHDDRGVCDRISPTYFGSHRNAQNSYNQNLVGAIDEVRVTHGIRPTWSLLSAYPSGASSDCNDNGIPDACDIDAGILSDANGDRFPDECAPVVCPGDVDGNGTVDGSDVTIVLAYWGQDEPSADLDGNGTVDGSDLTIVLAYWGKCG